MTSTCNVRIACYVLINTNNMKCEFLKKWNRWGIRSQRSMSVFDFLNAFFYVSISSPELNNSNVFLSKRDGVTCFTGKWCWFDNGFRIRRMNIKLHQNQVCRVIVCVWKQTSEIIKAFDIKRYYCATNDDVNIQHFLRLHL